MASVDSRRSGSSSAERDWNRAAFGAGHFSKSLVWSLADLLFGYHANAVMGLSAVEMGLLLTLTMVYSGILDIVVARALRAAEGRPDWTLKAQLVGGIATAAMLVLLFHPFIATPGVTFIYLAVAAMLFRTAYAVYDVAQNALTSLLPCDPADARGYVTIRMTLGATARLCIAASVALMIGNVAGVVGHGAFVTVPIALLVTISAVLLARVRPPVRATPAVTDRSTLPAGMMRPLLAGIAHAAGLSLLSRFLLFVNARVAGQTVGAMLLMSFVVGTVIGPIVTAHARARIGTGRTGIVLTALTILGAVPLAIAPLAAPSLAAAMLYGVGLGGSGALIWSATSDAIRDHADRHGVRTDLFGFAALTATIKLSVASTGVAFGVLLDGFKRGEHGITAAIVAITLIGGLGFVCAMRSRSDRLSVYR